MIGPEDRELVGKYLAGDLSQEEERLLGDRIRREHGLSEELGSQAGIDALMRFMAGSIGLSEHFRLRLPDQAGRRRLAFLRHVLLPLSVAAGLLLILYVSSEIAQRPPPQLCAEIVEMRGNAELIAPGGRSSPRPGDIVGPGRRLKTGTACRLKLRYPDGTTIGMLAGSSLSLGKHRKAKRIALAGGEVHVNVAEQPPRHPLVIGTPHAEVTVLGTRLALSVGPESTRLEVEEGRVKLTRLSDGRSVEVIAGQFAIAAVGVALAAQPVIRDWSQLQHDARHTGYTPETISAPNGFRVGWKTNFLKFDPPEHVYRTVQIIASDGRLFLPTQEGSLYALDPKTGKVEWRFRCGEGVMHTAGAGNGRVFFATIEGSVYAVDAKTGRQGWRWDNGRRTGFSSAVLLAEGKVFIGGRGGDFHAVTQADGKEVWKYDVPAPIYQTAAYNDGRVYFAAEDMHCYCLSAKDGKLLWKSRQLSGMSFRDYYPLVYGGVVILEAQADWHVRTRYMTWFPFVARWNPELKGWVAKHGDSLKKGTPSLQAMEDMLKGQDAFVKMLEAEPAKKLRFALDERTGQELFTLPCWQTTMCGPQPPPVVDRDGMLVMPVGFWSMYSWGRMDLQRRRVIDILYDGKGGTGNSDEAHTAAAAGSHIFAVHWYENSNAGRAEYFDMDTRKWARLPHGLKGCIGYHEAQCGTNPASIAYGAVYHQAYSLVHNWIPKE